MRIASLLPSSTEICFALGLGQSLVGVTRECDFPPQAVYKPILTHGRPDLTDVAPPPVDRHLREALHQGSSLYPLDHEALLRARPDLILTQELCEDCVGAYPQVLESGRILPGRPTVVSLEPATLADVLRSISELGQLTGTRERAAELVRGLWARLDAIRGAVAGRTRPRVVCLEWLDPLMVAGLWVPEQVDSAGGIDVLGESGARSRAIEADELAAAQPEVIIYLPVGCRLEQALERVPELPSLKRWSELLAVRAGQVYAVDGAWYFHRPGPRVVDGIEILARIFHPEAWKGPVPQGFEQVATGGAAAS